MRIEILGSGGATVTPRPFCRCAICYEARQQGLPYTRSGPSYFIHSANLLIDTPEDISHMLVRSSIAQVDAVIYSHWHPDHTLGLRVWEANITDHWSTPVQTHCTRVYLPQQVSQDFEQWFGLGNAARYLAGRGVIDIQTIADDTTISINGVTVRPFRVAEDYVYALLLSDGQSQVLIAPDELYNWQPPAWLPALDLAILPSGLMGQNPFSGEIIIPLDHPIRHREAMFDQTLDIVRQLHVKQVVLSHLEEPNQLSYADYERLAAQLGEDSSLPPIQFAHDQLIIDV